MSPKAKKTNPGPKKIFQAGEEILEGLKVKSKGGSRRRRRTHRIRNRKLLRRTLRNYVAL